MDMKHYVYAHINPISREAFYIGCGTGERATVRRGRNSKWRLHVAGLQKSGLPYGTELLHICDTRRDALRMEASEIAGRLGRGEKLLNDQVNGDAVAETMLSLSHVAEGAAFVDASTLEPRETFPLAAFVRFRRKRLKLTQQALADRAGVGLRFIRELEQANKPTLRMDKVNAVLDLFGACLGPVTAPR